MLKDTKYLIAYLLPLSCWFGLQNGGYWSPGAFYLAFGILPLFELFLPKSTDNVSAETEEKRSSTFIFDVLLWSNVPIVYGLLYFLFHQIQSGNISGWEIPFAILNVGMVTGSCGINVAHELGHRSNKFEQFLSKTLLLTELYMHFFIEHNLGHHKNVATDADPASSRLGESLYAFWFRSVKDSWFGAWKIEMQRLEKATISFWSLKNEMLIFQIIQIVYLASIAYFFSWQIMFYGIAAGIIGFLLLETVNYIEHYGLRRELLPNGRYENVLPRHSWNSDHELGRIFLYELTRHSDHHYKSTRKYQILRHFDESPQLPTGYPGSMWLSLFPPLWFKVMDKSLLKMQNE